MIPIILNEEDTDEVIGEKLNIEDFEKSDTETNIWINRRIKISSGIWKWRYNFPRWSEWKRNESSTSTSYVQNM